MKKLTVLKKVYWLAGEKEMTGITKQIFSDYVLVQAADGNYIVQRKALSLQPLVVKAGK